MAAKLPFVVECKSTYPFFEQIAAFNVECAARHYARECASTNPEYAYRVTVRGKELVSEQAAYDALHYTYQGFER